MFMAQLSNCRRDYLTKLIKKLDPTRAAYRNLSELLDHSYIHNRANHSEECVDLVTGANTNSIESNWCLVRTPMLINGSRKYIYSSY
ncbi:hypothetical protein HZS_730 [Henneguya salminicola]|nr:hypothetical protein HZS_730 [Henneguya salminicola]